MRRTTLGVSGSHTYARLGAPAHSPRSPRAAYAVAESGSRGGRPRTPRQTRPAGLPQRHHEVNRSEQGAPRAEREARHRSRPRGHQQRRARPAGQRPRRAARPDAAVRQDVGGPVGPKGMVPQGAAPHLIAAAIGAQARPARSRCTRSVWPTPTPRPRSAWPSRATSARRCDRPPTCTGWIWPGGAGGGGIWQSLAGSFSVSAYATPASRWLITPPTLGGTRADGPDREPRSAPGSQGAPDAHGAHADRPVQPGPGSGLPTAPTPTARGPQRRHQAARGRRGRAPLGLQVRRRRLAFVDGPRVPAGRRGAAAARLVQRRGGPRAVRRDRRTDPARRVDGLRHRPAGGRPALLHPGAAPGPRRRRRTARRLRPGLDVPAGDLPGLRRRGRGPRAGRRRAQPGPGHRPHHELLPPRRGPRARQGGRRGGRAAPRCAPPRAGWSGPGRATRTRPGWASTPTTGSPPTPPSATAT